MVNVTKGDLLKFLYTLRPESYINVHSRDNWLLAKYLKFLGYESVQVGVWNWESTTESSDIPEWYVVFLRDYYGVGVSSFTTTAPSVHKLIQQLESL